MDWNKASGLSGIGNFILGIVVVILSVASWLWPQSPQSSQSSSPTQGDGHLTGWIVALAVCIVVAAALHLKAASISRTKPEPRGATVPTVAIATPVDYERVGFRHIVRGYISPPDHSLQVLVFSGDGLWYLQPHVDVNGSLWTVECQFGNRDKPGGSYKIVAVLGDDLKERTYRYLSNEFVKSNLVLVQRQDSIEPTPNVVPAQHQCPDHWLHQLAENERATITAFVKVIYCSFEAQELSRPVPFIKFSFQLHNGSIFRISIEDDLEGFIEFDHPSYGGSHQLGGQLLMTQYASMQNCLPGNTGRFVIEQRLSREEAEMISAVAGQADAQFMFDQLSIAIVGADASQRLEPKRKYLHMGITMQKEAFEYNRN